MTMGHVSVSYWKHTGVHNLAARSSCSLKRQMAVLMPRTVFAPNVRGVIIIESDVRDQRGTAAPVSVLREV